jgi:hypothetical protein
MGQLRGGGSPGGLSTVEGIDSGGGRSASWSGGHRQGLSG